MFSTSSLLWLTQAASCSPTAAHRLPSIGALYAATLDLRPNGGREARADDLEGLLAAVKSANPQLDHWEDYAPADIRLLPLMRWGDRLFHMVPGSLERPIAMFERAKLVAQSVDGVLSDALGFTLSDLCELVLRGMDDAVVSLSPGWPGDVRPDPGSPALVSEEEVQRAPGLQMLQSLVERCTRPEASGRALDWATSSSVVFDPGSESAAFGNVLALRLEGVAPAPIPAGFWGDALDACIRDLACLAVEHDPSIERQFQRDAGIMLGRVIGRLGLPVYTHVPYGRESNRAVVEFDHDTLLAVELQASLTGHSDEIDRAIGRLEAFRPPAQRVVRLLVAATPGHMAMLTSAPNVAATTLDDLLWITNRSRPDPDDVLLFFKELIERPNVGHLVFLETINAFEHWRDNGKCLVKEGQEWNMVVLPFHRGDLEWVEAARCAPLERALLRSGLPESARWESVHFDDRDCDASVGNPPDGSAWRVRTVEPVVAVCSFQQRPATGVDLLLSLSTGILWRIGHSPAVRELITEAVGSGALLLQFDETPRDSQRPVVRYLGADGLKLRIGFDDRLEAYCEERSTGVEVLIGEAIAAGLSALGVDPHSFATAWVAAPAGFRMDAASLPVGQATLPAPVRVSEALASEARRALATRLKELHVTPGDYAGKDATRLDSEVVVPVLLRFLSQRASVFAALPLLQFALTELERALCLRWVEDNQRRWNSRFPLLGYDPVTRATQETQDIVRLERAIRIVIEEVLRQPPGGDRIPDRIEWRQMISLADICVTAGLRSEANHLGLTPVCTTISDTYGVSQHAVEGSLIDGAAFDRARAMERPQPGDRLTPTELGPVSLAMRQGEGFHPETVGLVLETIRTWETDPGQPLIRVTAAGLAQRCLESAMRPTEQDEVERAIRALTLTGEMLAQTPLEHWEQERHVARLLTRPIVAFGAEDLFLLPWQSSATWRVFQGYLSEGRCMWPTSSLSGITRAALEVFRKSRNRQLECVAATQFELVTPLVRRNVKKPKVLGLDSKEWHGEIDVVAVDEETGVIWVAEVKDLFVPFSPSSVRSSFRKFLEEPDYADKLLRKADSVRSNPVAVANAMGAREPIRNWLVQPLMVTRRIEPAAFAHERRVPFCALADVVDFISGQKVAGTK